MIKRIIVFIVCALIVLPCSVKGTPHIPDVVIAWNGGGEWSSSYSPNDVKQMGECKYGLNDMLTNHDGVFTAYWGLTFSPDPSVLAVWGIVNLTDEIQTFTYTVTAPVDPPITTNTMYGGSMSGSFSTDADANGILSTVYPDPLYHGLIDSVGWLQLYPDNGDPNSWEVGPNESFSIPDVSAGLPGPTLTNGPALTDIGIRFTFMLTPGDAAAFTGNFVVTPEPATICLLGFGALCLIRKRRA